jgi:YVTN family beta-propeller protein
VANQTDETISIIDTTASPVAVTATLSVGAEVTLLEMSGDDKTLFAPTGGAFLAIDTSTTPPGIVTIEDDTGGREPQAVTMAPGGATVYAINYGDNTIGIIDTASKSVVQMLTVGANPLGLALGGVPTRAPPPTLVPTLGTTALALLAFVLALLAAMSLRKARRENA